jgi:hypothetical protein
MSHDGIHPGGFDGNRGRGDSGRGREVPRDSGGILGRQKAHRPLAQEQKEGLAE